MLFHDESGTYILRNQNRDRFINIYTRVYFLLQLINYINIFVWCIKNIEWCKLFN